MKQKKPWISQYFINIFGSLIRTAGDFFSSKIYQWKKSQQSSKRTYRKKLLVPPHSFRSIKSRFNGTFSREDLPRIKDTAYAINLNDKQSKGAYLVSLFISKKKAVYFDLFGIEYTPQEVLSKIKDKSITHNIYRTEYNDSIMFIFYYITIIEHIENFVRLYQCIFS